MNDFPEELRRLMAEAGFSTYEVGRQVPCDPSLISRYRGGRQKPSARVAARLDEVLNAGGALAALAEQNLPGRRAVLAGGLLTGSLLTIGPDTLSRLSWAECHPRQVDAAAVESLADVLAAQRRAEDALGSAALLRPVLAQLGVVEELVRQVQGSLRPAVVDVGQQWAQFAGWLCWDTGDLAGARSCYGQALEWAAELGDATMTATVLVQRGCMAAEAGEVGPMIGLAVAAQRNDRAAAGQRAYAAGLEARGRAMAGDAAAAERKLAEAGRLATLADDPQGQRPWSYWMTPAFFRNEAGITCGYLAAAGPAWYRRAVDLLTTRPAGANALWAPATNLTHLAFAHARAGEVDQACATAADAAGAARRSGSGRLIAVLGRVHAELRDRRPGDTRVAQLAETLRCA